MGYQTYISDLTIGDIDSHEATLTCDAFYSSDQVKYGAIGTISEVLYDRLSWNSVGGDIIYMIMRETMNVIYSRTSQGVGEKDAKADLLYFIRELRHFGISVGADSLRWTGVDKELRDLADFIIFKQVGERGLPQDKRYLYTFYHPSVFSLMKPHEFVAVRKDGATQKRERIRKMVKFLSQPGALPCELDFLITNFEYQFGLTRRRIRQYLKVINDLGFIKIEGNLVTSPNPETITIEKFR